MSVAFIREHPDLCVLAVLFVLVALMYWRGRVRDKHICECGHRRDAHDEAWDDCLACSCTGFKRAPPNDSHMK